MLCLHRLCLTLLIILIVLRKTECRRMKKSRIMYEPPPLVDYRSTNLPIDSQITIFLQARENKTFYFFSSTNNTPLSITIVACSSPIYWSLRTNESGLSSNVSVAVDTYNFRSTIGTHILTLYAERKAYTTVYITRTIELPSQILDESKNRHLKLLKRRRRKKLTARWDQSLVDPYATTYCLVINSARRYSTLCAAQNDVINLRQQGSKLYPGYQVSTISNYQNEKKDALAFPKIICTGNKTHYTLTNLQQDTSYYFNVFAINGRTNLTYLHGSAVMKFDTHVKPAFLKDGKITSANLKKLDGKAFFTYKLEKKINSSLNFYIIPCGGSTVDVTLKYGENRSKKKVKRFGQIQIRAPTMNIKYHLKILSRNRYEFGKISSVKVLATIRSHKMAFPSLPYETIVHEYISLRKCDSVTVGWYAAPTNSNIKYCIATKKGKLSENGSQKIPDNCRIDSEMKSLENSSYCKTFSEKSGEIIIERIENLSPDQPYIIYVTVKKEEGKSLAYDLLQVHTKSECD